MKFLFLSLIVFGCLASQIHSELIVNSTLSAVVSLSGELFEFEKFQGPFSLYY